MRAHEQIVKYLLAGADVVMTAPALPTAVKAGASFTATGIRGGAPSRHSKLLYTPDNAVSIGL